MAVRVVNGNTSTEDGWPLVDENSCNWISVPGTNPPVHLQIQVGQPTAILRAWAADWNAYVERLRDADSACWTAGNSVLGTPGQNNGSNHLGGSACDLNWNDHTFRVSYAGFNQAQIDTVRQMLDFYEDTVFWGQDWQTPKDSMHVQMGYDTYGNPHTADFIRRKIRPDGYSTFRRGDMPAVDLAQVLADAMGDTLSLDRYGELLPSVQQALSACGCTSLNRVAMWMAQIGTESGGLQWMEEIADGSEYEGRGDLGNVEPGDGRRFKGRGPIQVTGRSNYAQLSAWAFGRGLVPTPTFFVDDPEELSSDRYGFLGVIWYWTVARPQINSLCDAGDLEGVTKAINGGYHGLEDRRNRWNRCRDMGDRLMLLAHASTPQPPSSDQEDDFMSALSPDEQRALYNEIMGQRKSLSPLRHVGEGTIGNIEQLEQNMDSSIHVLVTWLLAAFLKSPESIGLLHEVAGNTEPGREWDAKLAQAMLNKIAMMDQVGGCPVLTPDGKVANCPAASTAPAPAPYPTPPPAVPVTATIPLNPVAATTTTANPIAPSGGSGGVSSTIGALSQGVDSLRQVLSDLNNQLRS